MTSKFLTSLIVLLGICSFVSASPKIIPFRISNGLMVFRAKVQGQMGNYIFDTGIPNMVLNAQYFNERSNAVSLPSINGSSAHSGRYTVRMELDDFTLWGDASLVDLGTIERSKRMTIHGLIGLYALKRYEVVLDYERQEIQLHELTRKGDRKDGQATKVSEEILDLHFLEHIPYLSGKVNGEDLLLGLDTGAELNVLSDKLLSRIKPKEGLNTQKRLLLLGRTSTRIAKIGLTNVQLGQIGRPDSEAIFMSLKQLNELSGRKIDGLVGLNFLRNFQITLNFKKKKIYINRLNEEQQLANTTDSLAAKGNDNSEQR